MNAKASGETSATGAFAQSSSALGARRPLLLYVVARFCRRRPLAGIGALIIVLLVVLAAVGPSIAPYSYNDINLRERLQTPSAKHLFGTDDRGRDIFSRVIYGARGAVTIGFAATALATALATAIGLVSGYYGGGVDFVVQRAIEVWQAFPGLMFLIFVISIFKASSASVILTLAVLFAAGSSRVIRSAAIALRAQPFMESAKVAGATNRRVIVLHMLPNLAPVIIIIASVQIGAVVLAEASLSFLGFGTPPPFPTWGRMVSDGQFFVRHQAYMALFPGGAIALVVFAFNMLGDGLRDALDPRLRGT